MKFHPDRYERLDWLNLAEFNSSYDNPFLPWQFCLPIKHSRQIICCLPWIIGQDNPKRYIGFASNSFFLHSFENWQSRLTEKLNELICQGLSIFNSIAAFFEQKMKTVLLLSTCFPLMIVSIITIQNIPKSILWWLLSLLRLFKIAVMVKSWFT